MFPPVPCSWVVGHTAPCPWRVPLQQRMQRTPRAVPAQGVFLAWKSATELESDIGWSSDRRPASPCSLLRGHPARRCVLTALLSPSSRAHHAPRSGGGLECITFPIKMKGFGSRSPLKMSFLAVSKLELVQVRSGWKTKFPKAELVLRYRFPLRK